MDEWINWGGWLAAAVGLFAAMQVAIGFLVGGRLRRNTAAQRE